MKGGEFLVKKINVKGAIIPNDDKWIYDLFDVSSTCPKDVIDELDGLDGDPVQVTINSGGGDVYSASEIYTELKDYDGEVTTRIVGVAASAASVIAMAGKVKMSPTAEIMIHNAGTRAEGDYRTMDNASQMLQNTNKAVSAAYRHKTGMSEEELLDLMNQETWLTAEMAKEKGFVDEIMFDDSAAQKVASAEGMLPPQVINKVRNDKLKQPETITLNEIKNMMAEMKNDILNELKPEPAANNKQGSFNFLKKWR